jgi:hypothetical protein
LPGYVYQEDVRSTAADNRRKTDGCQVRWVSGRPGKPPAYAGTDCIIVRDGKITAIYLFFESFLELDITAATSIDVNLRAPILLAQAVVPGMRAKKAWQDH